MQPSYTEIKIRGYHIDLNGHVNNARYLEFAEEARWNHFEELLDWEEFKRNGWLFVVVNINLDYRQPIFLGDHLRIETRLKNAGQRSIVMQQIFRVKGKDKTAAELDVTFVMVDQKTGKSLPLEGRLREALLEH
ncbi:MAG: thioesterase family protein [Bacteroidota bacterium]